MPQTSIERLPTGDDPVILIRNLFSDNDIASILDEIETICRLNLLQPGNLRNYTSHPNSAIDNTGNAKVSFGLFLDDVYEPGRSYINNIVQSKLFQISLVDILVKEHYIFKYMLRCNLVSNLLSYYTTNGIYREHTDACILTSLAYFWKRPKQFTGGDLVFPETGYNYTPEFGDVITFPSIVPHALTPVHLTTNESYNGRFVVSTFMNRVSNV